VDASDIASRLFNNSMLTDSDLDAYINELFEYRYVSVKVLFHSHDILHAIGESTVRLLYNLSEQNYVQLYDSISKMNDVKTILRKFVDNIDALNWPWMFAKNEIKKNNGKLQCENLSLTEKSEDMVVWSHCMVNIMSTLCLQDNRATPEISQKVH
jgi:hypothetical protein